MRMAVALSMSLAVALASAAPAFGQDAADMSAQSANFEAAMAQAQAAAIHPGDDQLTCDQLQAEIGATMSSEEVQTNTAALGESAQRQQEIGEQARQQQQAMMTTSIVTGIASQFVPGMGYAQGLAMQAQMQAMQPQMERANQERAGMIGNMAAMMPQMMRGQRVYELAQAKQCPFIDEMQQQQQQQQAPG